MKTELRKVPRRHSRRVARPVPMLVFWTGKNGRYTADMYDLGIGGCFLNTAGDATPGEQIVLEIPKPTDLQTVVRFYGVVVPQKRKLKGFGMNFVYFSEEQQSVLTFLMLQSQETADRRGERA